MVLTHYHANLVGGYQSGGHPVTRATERTRDLVTTKNLPADAARSAIVSGVELLPMTGATTIDLGGRSVRVVPRGGHTDSDVTLELDDPAIVFCGDLVWHGTAS